MWKLTIKQTTEKEYDGQKYNDTDEVSFMVGSLGTACDIIGEVSNSESVGETEYILKREVEKNESVSD